MKRKRYPEEEIALALRQAKDSTTVEEICRKPDVSEARLTWWKQSEFAVISWTFCGLGSYVSASAVCMPASYAMGER